MQRRLSFLDNKVARRILVSFVLAALIPIGILGLLSYRQVGEQLHELSARSLHRSCKDYAIRLIDRLTLFESGLHLIAGKVIQSNRGVNDISLARELMAKKNGYSMGRKAFLNLRSKKPLRLAAAKP
jgi:hypothetical protein